jgi:hypothetical protein
MKKKDQKKPIKNGFYYVGNFEITAPCFTAGVDYRNKEVEKDE